MNVEYLRKKMNKFFAKVTVEELISQFEDMGYKFVDINKEKGKKIRKNGKTI